MTAIELKQHFLNSIESFKIQLDNLDYAKLVFNDKGELVVENEYSTQFSIEELTEEEIELFYLNI